MPADDALKRQGMEIRFHVRETPEWRLRAAELETEMLGRGMVNSRWVSSINHSMSISLPSWSTARTRFPG